MGIRLIAITGGKGSNGVSRDQKRARWFGALFLITFVTSIAALVLPIDAVAIARAALREGVQSLPTARLAGPECDIRQLALYRERLLDMRTRLV